MKHVYQLLTVLLLSIHSIAYSQLPDGSIAPNWTLTDINGNSHTLYNYLNQGKMVVLEFSATWCGPCWNYMMSGALETFWNEHGPNGADDAMVFYIESDWSTGMADLLGLTPTSQGNWVANISFPIIDLPSGNQTANIYGVNYYPTLYAVCHDATLYELGQVPATTWSNFVQSCNMGVEVADLEPALCAGDGLITAEPNGGFAPYFYQWSTGSTSQTISGLISGDYHVTVTEGYGKISKLDVFVPGATEPVTLSDVSIEPVLCNGSSSGNIFIDVQGGIPGYEYEWSNGSNSQNLNNVPADIYSLTVTDVNGCTLQQSFTVDEPDQLEASAETTPEDCDQADGTITLSISGGVGNYIVSSSEGTIFGNQIVDLPAGYVSVDVADQNGCIWSDVILIDFLDAPQLDVTQGAELNCIQSTTNLTGYASGGYNDFAYHWTTINGHITSDPNNATITVDLAGSYLLQVTDVQSECQSLATATVVSNINIPVVDAGEEIPINCENLQVVLNGSGDTLNTVTWTTTNGNIVSGGASYHPVVDAPGTYYIEVINPASNCSNLDSTIVPDNSAPAVSSFQFISSGLTMSGTDYSTGSNLSGWNWTFGDGNSSTDVNVVHTYAAAGTYEICHSVQNGCGVSQSCQTAVITSNGSVLTVDALVTNVQCFGGSTGGVVLTVGGGSGVYTYLWTGPDTTYTTSSIQDVPAGNYQVIVSDDIGNIFIGSFTIDQPSILALAGSTVVNNLCYGETNGSVSVDITGGVGPYQYSWNGAPPQAENFINQLPGGSVQAEVTDANGCVLPTGPFMISQPDQIGLNSTMVTDATNAEQNNGAIILDIKGGIAPYQVSWSNGAIGTSISGLSPGAYNFTIVDANGCQYLSPSPVIVNFSTGIAEAAWPEYVTIQPNPTKGDAIITWSELPTKNASLSIMSVDGKLMDSRTMSTTGGKWELASIGLTKGLYIVLLKQDKQLYAFKLIVM